MTYAAIISKKNSLWTKLQNFSVFAILFVKFLLFTPQKKAESLPYPAAFRLFCITPLNITTVWRFAPKDRKNLVRTKKTCQACSKWAIFAVDST